MGSTSQLVDNVDRFVSKFKRNFRYGAESSLISRGSPASDLITKATADHHVWVAQLHSTISLNNMEKIYTISKMVKFEHTWIVEPSEFEPHCPCCEITTGTTKWLLNCCTNGDGHGQCSNCYGPYLILLAQPSKEAIICVHEEGLIDRKVFLERGKYTMDSQFKLPLHVFDGNDGIPSNVPAIRPKKRRKIITQINFYENITMNYDVSYVL
ncbi:uncharacterized protein LOC118504108 isoform X2 [Anopheles stephensi]|uniref:uncharacterized protein LOC118504108 isoform X2 n=1 Tax=Anopheles stephensi TaxID=30069 RepID=UPI00165889AD|nr:uncharacterized protein LOC118504108 isoform X2 [Anopheles stephensi]